MGLNERQIKAVLYVKENGEITMSNIKKMFTGASEKTLYRDLHELVDKKILKSVGEKKGRKYTLR